MNKKYKLIKEYPGSPPLGTSVYKYIDFNKVLFEYRNHSENFCVKSKIIEDFPEYWQESKMFILDTKDNYEIYQGDSCYRVCNRMLIVEHVENINKEYPENTYFKEELNAKKYVEMQKEIKEKIYQVKYKKWN